jgi:glycerol uptake facilitator-like aquaporin
MQMEMEHESSCCGNFKLALSRLLYEFSGTFIFTMLFISNDSMILAAGLWVITIFSWKASGAQLNPAVTFAFICRKDASAKHMGVPLGLMYIGA